MLTISSRAYSLYAYICIAVTGLAIIVLLGVAAEVLVFHPPAYGVFLFAAALIMMTFELSWIVYWWMSLCYPRWLTSTNGNVARRIAITVLRKFAFAQSWLKAVNYCLVTLLTILAYILLRRWIILVSTGFNLTASFFYLVKCFLMHTSLEVSFCSANMHQQQHYSDEFKVCRIPQNANCNNGSAETKPTGCGVQNDAYGLESEYASSIHFSGDLSNGVHSTSVSYRNEVQCEVLLSAELQHDVNANEY